MRKGFTLIELLVVISIIAVLAALLLPNLVGVRRRASDSKLKSELKQMKTALRLYYNDYQYYPTDSSNTTMQGCGVSGSSACTTGAEFSAGTNSSVYMKEVPEYSEYAQTNNGDGFYMGVVLSNASDSDIAASVTKCGLEATATDNTFYVCED